MANIHLVTGYAGQDHITSEDSGALNASVFGHGQYVLGKGNKLSASIITNNQIRIFDGDILMQGRHIRLNEGSYIDLTIENGKQGYYRNDLIVARYTKNETTGIENVNLVVIKGEESTSEPADPSYTSGDILDGNSMLNDMPLYRVQLNGITVQPLVCLFRTIEETLSDFATLLNNAYFSGGSDVSVKDGGTGASDAATARSNLGITPDNIGAVKKSGDTMTGNLAIDRSSYPMVSFHVNNNAKANVLCCSGDPASDGGIILRGWNADGSAYKDLCLYYSNGMVVPVENGGTNATTTAGANQNLFDSGVIANATGYPTVPGIWRTIGTNIFSNLTAPHSNYGMLIIFKAAYALHLYIDNSGRFYWGYSGDEFKEPTNWYGQNMLSPDCYGDSLPAAGIPGRIFYKKV